MKVNTMEKCIEDMEWTNGLWTFSSESKKKI